MPFVNHLNAKAVTTFQASKMPTCYNNTLLTVKQTLCTVIYNCVQAP
ncbi:hypothetical protein ME9_00173 [Bartonella taylorii 8TBB]|uniref:Uncharacterized protein n=1 Tax=Bartonella taylorii 8TBB TaxID=1094560 RepID=A0A9P2S1B0_BARTA|nr:hypothetical protein ME9_00173 [Bartonella taylorii 8TBB]